MAYSIGDFVEADDATGSTLGTFDAPSFTPDSGSALVAFVWFSGGGSLVSVTMSDTAGGNDTWTEAGSGTYIPGDDAGMRAFVLLNAAATSTTVRATFGANVAYPAIAVVEVKGIQTSSALAGQALASQSSPGTSTDGVTTGNTGTLSGQPAAVIAGVQNTWTDSTPAVGTGYTSIGSGWDYGGGTNGGRFEHKRVTSTAAVAGTFTAGTDRPHQSIVVALLEAAGGTTDGAGSSSATSTASGVGASIAASPASSAGTSTATAVGASTAAASGSAAGTASATAVGASAAAGVGASDGAATATGVGSSTASSDGASAGTGTATGVGASTADAAGAADATSAASAVGASIAAGVGSSTAASTASAEGDSLADSEGSGDAAATSTATGVGASTAEAAGAAAGEAAAAGVGASIAAAVGSASSTSSADATGDALQEGEAVGDAAALSTAVGVGASIAAAVGNAASAVTVLGVAFSEPGNGIAIGGGARFPIPFPRSPQPRAAADVEDESVLLALVAAIHALMRGANP